MKPILVAGTFIAALVCAMPLASAELLFSSDQNISSRIAESGGKVGKDRIAFLWTRKFEPGEVPFTVVATCNRFNHGFLGRNKIIYKGVEMEGESGGKA